MLKIAVETTKSKFWNCWKLLTQRQCKILL